MKTSTTAKRFAIPLLLIPFLTACGATISSTSTPTIVPVATEIPKPSHTPSPTLAFTRTPWPSFTPWPTTVLNPTEKYIERNIKEILRDCHHAYVMESSNQSPDGNWTAYACPTLAAVQITNKDTSKRWKIPYEQFSRNAQIPDSLILDHWSSNSQYLYFYPYFDNPLAATPTACCMGTPAPAPYQFIDFTFDQLWQLNLETGKYVNIFNAIPSLNSKSHPSVLTVYPSPDGKTLLLIPQYWVVPPVVYVYDAQKNKIIHSFTLVASKESIAAGQVVWSADGQRFAIISASGGVFEPIQDLGDMQPDQSIKELQCSVIFIDLKKMSQKAIISNQKGVYITVRAITDENILLLEFTPAGGAGSGYYEQYNLTTNQFITPTP